MPGSHWAALRAIERCRTAALGGHVVECRDCRVQDYAYHSCRHRSCPKCMKEDVDAWVGSRMGEVLPVRYFHVVFTIPDELQQVLRTHQRLLYPVAMRAAAQTLVAIGAEPASLDGTVGVMATLHTWSRTLFYHAHVHCLVTAGSVDEQGRWRAPARPHLAPEEVLGKRFEATLRAMMVAAVEGLQLPGSGLPTTRPVYLELLEQNRIEPLLRYLGTSLYRGPIGNHQIVNVADSGVQFLYRDRNGRRRRKMQLGGQEFLRRVLQHVWPKRLHKVQYHGLWSRRSRPQLDALLGVASTPSAPSPEPADGISPESLPSTTAPPPFWLKCPHCNGLRAIRSRFGRGVAPPPLRGPRPPTLPPELARPP